jgi:polyribonucleotide nucleotidyltransferase
MMINPSRADLENADLDMIIAGTEDNIMMVEGEMKEGVGSRKLEAIQFGHQGNQETLRAQIELERAGNHRAAEYSHELTMMI